MPSHQWSQRKNRAPATTLYTHPLTESVSTEIVNSTVFGVPLSHTLRESWGQPAIVTVFIAAIVLMVVLQFVSEATPWPRSRTVQ